MIQGTSRRFLGDLKSQSRMTEVCLLNSRLIDDTPLVKFNEIIQWAKTGATTRGNHKGGNHKGLPLHGACLKGNPLFA